ncbi:hypothetical protein ACFVUW_08545 [Streptomyces xiamenensis]|uniref:imine reductase family protein n=1 Tax=Streptomyces xiamenensis TaxID=408015 RepID=UPI0036F105AB
MTPHPPDVTVLGPGGMGSALAGAARDVDASVLRSVKALADRAVAQGHGGDDSSRLVEVIRPG